MVLKNRQCQLVFTRMGKWAQLENLIVLEITFLPRVLESRLDQRMGVIQFALLQLLRACIAWRETESGKEAFQMSGEDFNVGDLVQYLDVDIPGQANRALEGHLNDNGIETIKVVYTLENDGSFIHDLQLMA